VTLAAAWYSRSDFWSFLMPIKLLIVFVAYLLGSIPFGYLLVKYLFAKGEDIRQIGSGGTGATNVTRRAGKTAGFITYLLDVAKGVASVTLMSQVSAGDYAWMGAAGIASIVGHIFPLFLGFRGGKGVATGAGILITMSPLPVLTALILWAIVFYLTGYVSLASLFAAGAVPLFILLFYGLFQLGPPVGPLTLISTICFALILFAHRENIKRLARGEEKRMSLRMQLTQPKRSNKRLL
jgi:glycerol-3-phosphate acyltransferase PlsY